MEYPKFVPAGNSANGFNPNEMIDLADIFDGAYKDATSILEETPVSKSSDLLLVNYYSLIVYHTSLSIELTSSS